MKEKIIDLGYINEYQKIHTDNINYGSSSVMFFKEIQLIILFLQPKSILDYGCGKGALIDKIQKEYPHIKCFKYDPAIPEYNTLPDSKVDLLINTDVLEHIPKEHIDYVLSNIASISQNVYFNLHHGLAVAVLSNGDNAHCTIETARWYHDKMKKYFKIVNPLKGREEILSAVVTFDIDQKFMDDYLEIIKIPFDHSVGNYVDRKICQNKDKSYRIIRLFSNLKNNFLTLYFKILKFRICISVGKSLDIKDW